MEQFVFECLHCGQNIDRDGKDERGQTTCGEFAADPDMADFPHDADLGADSARLGN